MGARKVLAIAVSDDLVECWRGWFAPPRQPFPIDLVNPAVVASIPVKLRESTKEWTDTFAIYSGTWSWFSEAEFNALPYRSRRAPSATEHGGLSHAAVTLGGGWLLHKPSQSWSSPRLVVPVRDLVNRYDFPTTRLFRRRMTS